MGEFEGSRGKGLEEWNSEVKISEEQVDDFHEAVNHELEEAEVNNDIEENQLANPQCELARGNGEYNRGGSQKIIEQEMEGREKKFLSGELITVIGAPQG